MRQTFNLLAAGVILVRLTTGAAAADSVDWPNVFNDKGGTRYSTLAQINRENVKDLKVAWRYHTGDSSAGRTIECTPVVIDGVMYITTVTSKVVALDAATGTPRWSFDPYDRLPSNPLKASGGVNRGVAYWSDGKEGGQRRIFLGAADGRLISLDAATGTLDRGFGLGGIVDFRADIEYDVSKRSYGPTSAPLVFEDRVIVGFSNDESFPAAPGDTRAFDTRTGKEMWRFHAIPRPGEKFGETWELNAGKERGGGNSWGGLTLDAEHGIVFLGTGCCTADFYGGDRKGDNLFGNCSVALDARTGRYIWHFQSVHHDLWDHDNPCPPVVVKVRHEGKEIEAVAQVTKTGYCFLLDRLTGKPIFGVKEVPAAPSDIDGEQASPTQPVPLAPPAFSRTRFDESDVTDRSPAAHEWVLNKLRSYRSGEGTNPPTEQGTVVTPGFHGGATWSGASFDPTTGLLYVNANDVPVIARLKKKADGTFAFAGYGYFADPDGYPAIKPPWGTLTAIDLNTGKFAWRIVLGAHPELTAKGVPQTGTENFGGTIVTAGGLVFIGGTKDEKFHAFDKSTGKLLWDFQLNAGGYATPCTYSVAGRQYVAIAAGGGGKPRTRSGDEFVVFVLPDRDKAK